MASIDSKIARGAAWMLAFKMLDKVTGLLSTIILARMLTPGDFGLVAMAMVLLGGMYLLVSFSFDIQLIQNPKAGPDHFNTAWTFNVIFATVCALCMTAIAIPASAYYDQPDLEIVMEAGMTKKWGEDWRGQAGIDQGTNQTTPAGWRKRLPAPPLAGVSALSASTRRWRRSQRSAR